MARHGPRAIDIEDMPLLTATIPQAARLTSHELACHQVLQEQGAQGFDRAVIQTREKARERGAMGQLLAPKEGHEGTGKGKDVLIEGLQGAFPAQRIAQEHGHKIDDVIGPHAPTGQAHALADGLEHAQVGEVLRHQAHFAKPLR